MKTLNYLLLFALGFLVLDHVSAQQAATLSLSLKQAQEYALQNNYGMKNSQLDIELAKKKIWETTAIGLPQVNADGSYQHIFKVPEISFGEGAPPVKLGVADNITFNFTVSQLVFSGEYLVGLQATKVFYQISQNSLQQTTADLRESVANSYYLVLILEKNRDILDQSLKNLNITFTEMKEMHNAGFIEDTDVDQIELTLLTLENGLKSVDKQVGAAYDVLSFQLGIPFDKELILTESLDEIIKSSDIASIVAKQFNVESHISYKIMENQESVAKLNLKRQKSTFLPSLAAFYKHTEIAQKADFDFTIKDIAGLSLNVPLFSSGQRSVQVQQRILELEKVRNSKTNVAQGLQLDFINSRNELNTAYDAFLNQQRNIRLTESIYNKTLLKYKEGVSSSMDLTMAQNQYLDTQRNYFNALYTLLSSKNKLEKLLNLQ